MSQQWPDEPPPEGRGVFIGCLISAGLILVIMALILIHRWLGLSGGPERPPSCHGRAASRPSTLPGLLEAAGWGYSDLTESALYGGWSR